MHVSVACGGLIGWRAVQYGIVLPKSVTTPRKTMGVYWGSCRNELSKVAAYHFAYMVKHVAISIHSMIMIHVSKMATM